jgi:hypothetical protein
MEGAPRSPGRPYMPLMDAPPVVDSAATPPWRGVAAGGALGGQGGGAGGAELATAEAMLALRMGRGAFESPTTGCR